MSALCSMTLGNPAFMAAQPHLKIEGKIICQCFLPALCTTATTPPYWDYLRKKFTWTQVDINSVQWEILTSALNSFTSQDQ